MNRTQKQAGQSIAQQSAQQGRTEASSGILHGDGGGTDVHRDSSMPSGIFWKEHKEGKFFYQEKMRRVDDFIPDNCRQLQKS